MDGPNQASTHTGGKQSPQLICQPWLTKIDCAGQRVGLECGEQQRDLGDVLDRGELLVDGLGEHHLFDHALLGDAELLGLLGDLLLDQRRPDEARANDVGADAVLGAFLGHHAPQAEKAVLRRHVGRLQRRGLVAVHRAHVDERARALLVHMLDAGLGGQEGAVDMDGQDLLPVGKGKVLDRMHDLDAGIGDENVDRAEGLTALLDAGVHLLFVGDVHGDGDGRLAVAELAWPPPSRLEVEIGDHHAAARLDIALGNVVADAARSAGDEGNFAVELMARILTFLR